MVAVIFGVQGVGKSSIVNGVMANFSGEDSFKLLQWGSRMFEIAFQKNIIRVGDYKTQGNFQVQYEDLTRGVTIVISEQGENLIYARDEACSKNAKDEIRHLDLKTQKMLQTEVSNSFASEIFANPSAHYLVETHAALKTLQGYLPGLTIDFMQKVDPDVYIIIEANADEIFARRLNDKERKRDHDKTIKDVQVNLDTTRYFTSSFAAYSHSTLCIVENKDKLVGDAIEEITRILRFI